jgi:hypothetical protein
MMNLLAPGQYQVFLHYWSRSGLDFTVLTGPHAGERHCLHTFPRHVTEMVIALTRWRGKVADVSRHQVIISVGIKIKGEFAFNTLAKISPTETLIPFESGVPTLAELKELPIATFEELGDAAA